MSRKILYAVGVLALGWISLGASCPPPPGGGQPPVLPTQTNVPPPLTTATAGPTSTVVPPSFTYCTEVVTSTCQDLPDHQPAGQSFVNLVRSSMQKYMAQHPEQFEGDFFKWNDEGTGPSQDVFMQGIANLLKQNQVDACIDVRGGDLIVSAHAWKAGDPTSFAETYHPISGWNTMAVPPNGRIVQWAPLVAKCSPRWF